MITICPECGHQVSEKATSCPECGYPVSPAPQAAPTEGPSGGTYQYKYHYTPQKSHGCRSCLITLAVVALIALLCIGGIVFACYELTTDTLFSGTSSHTVTQTGDTTRWEADTTATPPPEDDDSAKADTLTPQEDGSQVFTGYIGGKTYPIQMTLSFTPDGDVSGNYIYTNRKLQTPITLLGNYQSPYLTLYESNTDDSTTPAYFEGKYDGESFAGSYTNAGGQEYAFMLKIEE